MCFFHPNQRRQSSLHGQSAFYQFPFYSRIKLVNLKTRWHRLASSYICDRGLEKQVHRWNAQHIFYEQLILRTYSSIWLSPTLRLFCNSSPGTNSNSDSNRWRSHRHLFWLLWLQGDRPRKISQLSIGLV